MVLLDLRLLLDLGNGHLKNTVVELSLDVVLGYILTYIEAPAA